MTKSSEIQKEILSFEDAFQRIHAPRPVFNSLLISGLLGDYTEKGVPLVGVEHFKNYGTQWRSDLWERLSPNQDKTFVTNQLGQLEKDLMSLNKLNETEFNRDDVISTDKSEDGDNKKKGRFQMVIINNLLFKRIKRQL